MSTAFDVSASPDRVAAYLSVPRNLLTVNRQGRIVEQSEPPTRTGSWFVLAFDQLLVRVEYTALEPPDLVSIWLSYSGRGSGGLNQTCVYRLGPIPGSSGTRISLDAESTGGWISDFVNRPLGRMTAKRNQRRMEADLQAGE